ncbi:hypothetical protein ES703_63805 [subsurface metagenome]
MNYQRMAGIGRVRRTLTKPVHKNQPDDRRVHFDLQMKPLIRWVEPDDEIFRSRLERRLKKTVLKAITEMHRQVGELKSDKQGIALRGLIIRHLVMPNRVAGTKEFVRWVAEALSKSTYVNIMSQYRVEYKAYDYPEIGRGITVREFLEAVG